MYNATHSETPKNEENSFVVIYLFLFLGTALLKGLVALAFWFAEWACCPSPHHQLSKRLVLAGGDSRICSCLSWTSYPGKLDLPPKGGPEGGHLDEACR